MPGIDGDVVTRVTGRDGRSHVRTRRRRLAFHSSLHVVSVSRSLPSLAQSSQYMERPLYALITVTYCLFIHVDSEAQLCSRATSLFGLYLSSALPLPQDPNHLYTTVLQTMSVLVTPLVIGLVQVESRAIKAGQVRAQYCTTFVAHTPSLL